MQKKGKENPTFKDRTGEKYISNQGYTIEIIKYYRNDNITVLIDNKHIINNIRYNNIIKGSVSNPFHPSVYNVGYLGEAKNLVSKDGKNTKVYYYWHNILKRSYSDLLKEKYPTYKDVTVCEEWYNFQNFAQWFEENYNPETMENWEIDKDILVKGNKVYSPDTCCFVPHEINSLFTKTNSKRGNYPIGVHKQDNKYVAQINVNKDKQHYLGFFNTPEEAFKAYKTAKESHIKKIAEKYKNIIKPETYQALINYEVKITD